MLGQFTVLKKVLFQTQIIYSLDFSHAIGLCVASNLIPRLPPGVRGLGD